MPRRRHERGQHLLVFGCILSSVSVFFNRDRSLTARIAAAPVAASTCSRRGFNAFLGGGDASARACARYSAGVYSSGGDRAMVTKDSRAPGSRFAQSEQSLSQSSQQSQPYP